MNTRRSLLWVREAETMQRLQYSMWSVQQKHMSQETGRVVAALVGRQMEAIRLGMELIGIPPVMPTGAGTGTSISRGVSSAPAEMVTTTAVLG